MGPSQHTTSPLTYAPVLLGLIGGYMVREIDGGELAWLSHLLYGIGGLALVVFLAGHKTVRITQEAIEVNYLRGTRVTIKKSEVEYYAKKSVYGRRGHFRVTYTFYKKGDGRTELSTALLNDERGVNATLDEFTSTLPVKPNE